MKEYLEKQLEKHDSTTVYDPENVPCSVSKKFYITRENSNVRFEMDYKDLESYCYMMGLALNPRTNYEEE